MSRVSDAFRRAAEETGAGVPEASQRLVGSPLDVNEIDLKVKRQLPAAREMRQQIDHEFQNHKPAGTIGDANPSKRLNGHGRLTVVEESDAIPKGAALRAWIEQLLFGRDLRKIEAHPLIALEKNSHAGEQYKILREQINKVIGESAQRFLAITSPIKGDGKTTVAANLAAAMALHRDRQVLLIDADLRSPSIHRYFGVNSSPGLADYLSLPGDCELMDYIRETSVPGLRLLTAGKATSHSSELLASERMKNVMEEIAGRFSADHVIIDTSPVLSTSDPLVLSRQLDGLLMVVRAGKTPRDCLSEAIKLVGADKIMGLVLNGAELGRSAKYYYYYGQQ